MFLEQNQFCKSGAHQETTALEHVEAGEAQVQLPPARTELDALFMQKNTKRANCFACQWFFPFVSLQDSRFSHQHVGLKPLS